MAFTDRLIDMMLANSDPNKGLERQAIQSMIMLNDANAAASVGKVLNDLNSGDQEANATVVAALERIVTKIAGQV